jgi:hypothetical protein
MIIIKQLRLTAAVEEWMMKEEGSFEDSKRSKSHAYALLQRLTSGSNAFTAVELDMLISSGEYQSTAWEDDEIAGGKRTKDTIARVVKNLKQARSLLK